MGQCLYFYAFLLTIECEQNLAHLKKLPPLFEKEFKQTIGSGEGEMFSLTKEENSNNLLISLLSKESVMH
jgi:peroxiredoxin